MSKLANNRSIHFRAENGAILKKFGSNFSIHLLKVSSCFVILLSTDLFVRPYRAFLKEKRREPFKLLLKKQHLLINTNIYIKTMLYSSAWSNLVQTVSLTLVY